MNTNYNSVLCNFKQGWNRAAKYSFCLAWTLKRKKRRKREWERNPVHPAPPTFLSCVYDYLGRSWKDKMKISWKNINPVLCKLSPSYKLQRYLENVEKLKIFPFFTILAYFLENLKFKSKRNLNLELRNLNLPWTIGT